MRPHLPVALLTISALFLPAVAGDTPPLDGYSPAASQAERAWETKFRAIPSAQIQRDEMQRLAARPHHVGSPYDKENAEWILARFKEWGWDAKIEQFDVLFPTPKRRVLELVAPTRFTAKLEEPAEPADPSCEAQKTAGNDDQKHNVQGRHEPLLSRKINPSSSSGAPALIWLK